MYCKCDKPKAVEVIIDNSKHSVCSKNKQGCGLEIKKRTYVGEKLTMYINGVEVKGYDSADYFTINNLPPTSKD